MNPDGSVRLSLGPMKIRQANPEAATSWERVNDMPGHERIVSEFDDPTVTRIRMVTVDPRHHGGGVRLAVTGACTAPGAGTREAESRPLRYPARRWPDAGTKRWGLIPLPTSTFISPTRLTGPKSPSI